jgi:hypothetical protein
MRIGNSRSWPEGEFIVKRFRSFTSARRRGPDRDIRPSRSTHYGDSGFFLEVAAGRCGPAARRNAGKSVRLQRTLVLPESFGPFVPSSSSYSGRPAAKISTPTKKAVHAVAKNRFRKRPLQCRVLPHSQPLSQPPPDALASAKTSASPTAAAATAVRTTGSARTPYRLGALPLCSGQRHKSDAGKEWRVQQTQGV